MIEIEDKNIFKKRQQKLAEVLKDATLILVSGRETVRNYEVNNKFRVDSNFFYLTGFEEPEAVFVFRPGRKPERVLFVLEKDKAKEQWLGTRFGPEAVCKFFAVDQGYNIGELNKKLGSLLKDTSELFYTLGHSHYDKLIVDTLIEFRNSLGRTGKGLIPIKDPTEIIGELRVIKSEDEISWLKKAAKISSLAITEVMNTIKPGMTENQVEGILLNTYKQHGSKRVAYNPIVGSGNNACILHYDKNCEVMKENDLLLIDAGCEWKYYAGDITRTFPVSGEFTKPQREFYQHVLDTQKKIITLAKPGVSFDELQNETVKLLESSLIGMGFKKSKDLVKKYYPHRIGHFLGLDTHDAGLYQIGGKPRKFEAGMCLTIEPGLYVMNDDKDAPKEFRGLGVRIEDDVLITKNGNEVLSNTPKDI